MQDNFRINGPYTRKDGRKYLKIWYSNGKQTTMSYPKYLMEQHLGRKLLPDETVDHINRDFTDDRIENLRIVSRSQHGEDDAKRVKPVEVHCIWCNEKFYRIGSQIRHNSDSGHAGPFCKSCAGKYGKQLQMGLIKKLTPQPSVESEYYYKDKK